jgi:hypothetical protein
MIVSVIITVKDIISNRTIPFQLKCFYGPQDN